MEGEIQINHLHPLASGTLGSLMALCIHIQGRFGHILCVCVRVCGGGGSQVEAHIFYDNSVTALSDRAFTSSCESRTLLLNRRLHQVVYSGGVPVRLQ